MYQISIVAAFISGMIALFAPCCITYLLPAYLGNIFKEKKQVLFMTLVYSLGIFVVMLPVVLGAKILSDLFFELHDQTYLFGGLFMMIVAVISFLGLKLPMPRLAMQGRQKTDIVSTFTLGIFSGITSACCAPVLMGVIALSSLSPSIILALGVGFAYVLGMVTPLYFAALFLDKGKLLERPILKKRLGIINLLGQQYVIMVSNVLAAIVFGVVGTMMIYLTLNGSLAAKNEEEFMKWMTQVVYRLSEVIKPIPFVDVVGVVIISYLLYMFVKRAIVKLRDD